MADKFQKKALTDANTNTLGNRVATGGLEDFGSSKVLPLTQTKRGLVTKMVANREEPEPAVPVQWDTHHASSPGDIEGIQMVPRATITRAPFLDKVY
jgi:DNA polymerase epsilon subunit 1